MGVAAWSTAEGGKVKTGMLVLEVSNRRLEGFEEGRCVGAGASEGVVV